MSKENNCHSILIGRRSFIQLSGLSLAALLASEALSKTFAGSLTQTTNKAPRRLVVLEMNGGNDGLNTVIPYGDGAYYDLRQRLAIKPEQVLPLDETWGLHPSLPLLKQRCDAGQVAIFRGVGHSRPDLSHFAMMDYWRAGHPAGSAHTGGTGWLGRLLDVVGDAKAPLAGATLSTSVTPALLNRHYNSAAVLTEYDGYLEIPDAVAESFRAGLKQMAAHGIVAPAPLKASRQGLQGSLALSDFLNQLSAAKSSYPETETGRLLSLAARILAANDWVRVVHIPLPLEFDTHVAQRDVHAANLAEIDNALDAFLKDLATLKLAEQTLVLTTSEFGRRAGDNGGDGTDHGTASSLFIIGQQVKEKFYGDAPSLTDLDENGNLVATVSFQDLLATVAEGWMGAPASEVVPGGRRHDVFS